MEVTARLVGFEGVGRDLAGTAAAVVLQMPLAACHRRAPCGGLQGSWPGGCKETACTVLHLLLCGAGLQGLGSAAVHLEQECR